ncbi:hypothetical protein AT05_02285 [Schleiferia thermophila str. Yellowstone]|uniref:ATP-grasp domain-containing protein n=1 Tax=Schleiferia thermophila TaxID=884107 RepID=UPI0004E6CD43|nr:ATP-grasp domain-containing protein [Schleiferia thermophila]KFD40142.1 hypothetical protein AT05_02285 [Schleiferia thermophila str. Yellowstone]
MRILVTGVGGPTPRSFAASLKKYSTYAEWELFGTDINPYAIGLYKKELFNECFLISSARNPDEYWNDINQIVFEKKIDYAIILPELEVIEWSKRQASGNLPCPSIIPDFNVAKVLIDKSKMTELLEDLKIVPLSVKFHRNQTNFESILEKLSFPFWVRSTSGTSGLGSLKVNNLSELISWIQINPDVDQFMASEYLPGRNLACKLLYWKGNLIRAATAERVSYIMSKVAPSGITGNTSFGRLINEPLLVELTHKALERIFNYCGALAHGFFTADFKEDKNGKPYITEINIRHVAFTQCFAAGGANFAEDTMRLLDNDPQFNISYKMYEFEKNLIFLRDVDEVPILMKEEDLLKKLKS